MQLLLNLCCQFIINKGQDCRLQINFFCNVSNMFWNESASPETGRQQIGKDCLVEE